MTIYFNNYQDCLFNRLADDARTPSSILVEIAHRATYNSIKMRVINHQNSNERVLEVLMNDEASSVLQTIAESNKVTPVMVETLITKSRSVKYGLAKNPKIPIEYKKKLAEDEDRSVMEILAQLCPDFEVQKALFERDIKRVDYHMAHNRNLHSELFIPLYDRACMKCNESTMHVDVRYVLVGNQNADKEFLTYALNDNDYNVRRRVQRIIREKF